MKLTLNRIKSGDRGTNGRISHEMKVVCYCIERPWLGNRRRISCIPAGEYELKKRYSEKFGWHLILVGVPNRDLILIHPANNAMKELNGCIAPVSDLSGLGTGTDSRKACKKLFDLVFAELEKEEKVYLNIT